MVRAVLAASFIALGTRLFFIQVVNHAHYAAESVSQVRVNISESALRGGIYDRNGQILAVSRPTSVALADGLQITQPVAEATALSPLIGIAEPTLEKELAQRRQPPRLETAHAVCAATVNVRTREAAWACTLFQGADGPCRLRRLRLQSSQRERMRVCPRRAAAASPRR